MATNSEIIKTMLLADLGMLNAPSAISDYLDNLIEVSKNEIAREGIILDLNKIEDCQTVEMYSAYLYRKRASEDTGMPRMLRWRLNNMLFSQKASVSDV